jgi:pimeloyl-ACP methyl ester carboxylesterase
VLDHDLSGFGSDVVLLHAAIGDRRLWDDQFGWVASRHRAIRCDLRGFGNSQLPAGRFSHAHDVADLLQTLGVERAVMVAGSLGGRVALELAVAWPSLVDALVLVSPALTGFDWTPTVRAFGDAEDAALERGDLDEAVELNMRMWFDGPDRLSSAVDAGRRAAAADMQRRAFELQLAASDDTIEEPTVGDVRERLRDIEATTVVVVGEHDVTDFHSIATLLSVELAESRRITLPATAHVPNYERPDLFNPLLADLLVELTSP